LFFYKFFQYVVAAIRKFFVPMLASVC